MGIETYFGRVSGDVNEVVVSISLNPSNFLPRFNNEVQHSVVGGYPLPLPLKKFVVSAQSKIHCLYSVSIIDRQSVSPQSPIVRANNYSPQRETGSPQTPQGTSKTIGAIIRDEFELDRIRKYTKTDLVFGIPKEPNLGRSYAEQIGFPETNLVEVYIRKNPLNLKQDVRK